MIKEELLFYATIQLQYGINRIEEVMPIPQAAKEFMSMLEKGAE